MPSRVAVVIGAGGGIGSTIAAELIKAGDKVYLLDLESNRHRLMEELVQRSGGRAEFIPCDLSDSESIRSAFKILADTDGRLDCCINAAGIIRRGAFVELSEKSLFEMVNINITGSFIALQTAAELMITSGGGRIVNLTSVHGLRTTDQRAAYAMCKGAMLSLTRALAVELAPHGILVNAVAPGPVSTGMQEGTSASRSRWQSSTPLGRVASSIEVARAVMFLASAENSFINGDTLIIDGGASVSMGSITEQS
ncbi:SDR family NAD(P)-dependent oxidoreductase [Nitrincola alkalilacustris]|uniref:SDR family NAD(P)-dependent oxidoreductase n=1 Tax=Nitrincola alkalilacustris TaxID=1571224 RepID=UPI00124D9B1C|nr:SDR family oxidoreductase [Nitrincola alkalilacustris]